MSTTGHKPVKDDMVDEPEWLLPWLWQADPVKGWPLDQRCERIVRHVMLAIQDLESPPKALSEDD